jgi:hypothetical protein
MSIKLTAISPPVRVNISMRQALADRRIFKVVTDTKLIAEISAFKEHLGGVPVIQFTAD